MSGGMLVFCGVLLFGELCVDYGGVIVVDIV